MFLTMRSDPNPADGSVALAEGSAGGSRAGAAEPAGLIAVPAPLWGGWRLPRGLTRPLSGRLAGRLALGTLLAGTCVLAVFATGRASALVPRSTMGFPHWESGPLHFLFGHPGFGYEATSDAFSVFLVAMLAAYGLSLIAVRSLSMRAIAITVVALHVVLLMVPPMQLNDVWNYLGYARLGALHGMNPYVHQIAQETHDPIFRFATWHDYSSPYGQLFTAITYPLGLAPLAAAYWILKVVTVGLSLLFIWLVYRCARLLGRDGRFAVLFVAANPLYLFYEVADFHNDPFMLVPAMAAIMFLLQRRDRSAGAAVMLGVFVKFTIVLILPFLLLAARRPARWVKVLTGAVLAGLLLAAGSYLMFGANLPNLTDQSSIVTPFSLTNLFGDLIGAGGATPAVLRYADLAVVLVVLLCLRRRRDWIGGIGWSTIALVASLSWLMPWYIVWALPLAALSPSVRLRRATLAFTVFLVLTFLPVTGQFLTSHGLNPMSSPFGQRAQALEQKLTG
jgi:alpha-1,6-mannosyltransferase